MLNNQTNHSSMKASHNNVTSGIGYSSSNQLPSIKDLLGQSSHQHVDHKPFHNIRLTSNSPPTSSSSNIHPIHVTTTMDSLKNKSSPPPVLQPSQISQVISPQQNVQYKRKKHVGDMEMKQYQYVNGNDTYPHHVNGLTNMHGTSNNMHMMTSQLEYINLERKCDQQLLAISQLQLENKMLRDELAQLKRKREEATPESNTKRKVSNSSNACITFSSIAFDESSSSDHSEIDPSQMVVNWNSKEYYLVGAFKSISSRTRVLVNFVPMFEKEHPDKECKLVLNSEEFKRLAKENVHLFKQSKHTWRISLFSSDFYQYVKSKTNH